MNNFLIEYDEFMLSYSYLVKNKILSCFCNIFLKNVKLRIFSPNSPKHCLAELCCSNYYIQFKDGFWRNLSMIIKHEYPKILFMHLEDPTANYAKHFEWNDLISNIFWIPVVTIEYLWATGTWIVDKKNFS